MRLHEGDDSWAPALGDRGRGREQLRWAGGGIGPKGQLGRSNAGRRRLLRELGRCAQVAGLPLGVGPQPRAAAVGLLG
jgi:hypothetical protein